MVVATLISAMAMLIWNGSSFVQRLSIAEGEFSATLKIAAVALSLNVALILFGWRRYADLQHETEKRIEGEQRAQIIASTDGMTGLLNRKGFGDNGAAHRAQRRRARRADRDPVDPAHRFKTINDRYGYESATRCCAACRGARPDVPAAAALARLSGGEFAVAVAVDEEQEAPGLRRSDRCARSPARSRSRASISRSAPSSGCRRRARTTSIPDLLRRADIAMDHAKSAASARPMWFDSGMERELIAHSEIEQGIRFGLEHDQFVPFFEPQVDLAPARSPASRCSRGGITR